MLKIAEWKMIKEEVANKEEQENSGKWFFYLLIWSEITEWKKKVNEWMKEMHNDYNEWMIKYEVICIENGDKEWMREWERWFHFLHSVYDQIYILLC